MSQYLDRSALVKVITRLDEGLVRHLSSPEDSLLQDGLILRLKAAYELSYETRKRYLRINSSGYEQDHLITFTGIISNAYEKGLVVGGIQDWLEYRVMYSNAKQAYQEASANQALRMIPKFLNEAFTLIDTLSQRTSN